jgi:hypothetical protein
MSDKRQKNQLVLTFTEEERSEAPKTLQEGTESLTAKCETERRAVRTARGDWRIAPLYNTRYPSLTSIRLVFLDSSMALRNPLNRRMRTRMSGGVAGESGRPLPLCRFRTGFWPAVCRLLLGFSRRRWPVSWR